ncbi:MAG: Ig-like domain-containing protein [Caldilineaceae bacterium]
MFIQFTRLGIVSPEAEPALRHTFVARASVLMLITLSALMLPLFYRSQSGALSEAIDSRNAMLPASFMPPQDYQNKSASALMQVNQPPQISFFSPANNSSFVEGNAIVLLAAASDSDGTVIKVEFFADSNKIGEDTNGGNGWGFSWIGATAGPHTLTMAAADDGGAVSVSPPIQITVLVPTPTFTPTNTSARPPIRPPKPIRPPIRLPPRLLSRPLCRPTPNRLPFASPPVPMMPKKPNPTAASI